MIVVDTNVLSYLYFPSSENGVVEQLKKQEKDWAAPELWKSEFLNVATLYFRKGLISLPDTIEAFEKANEFILSFEIHSAYKDILAFVKSSSCSSYDCEFIVLAQKLDAKLITYDKQLIYWFPAIAIKPEDYLAETK